MSIASVKAESKIDAGQSGLQKVRGKARAAYRVVSQDSSSPSASHPFCRYQTRSIHPSQEKVNSCWISTPDTFCHNRHPMRVRQVNSHKTFCLMSTKSQSVFPRSMTHRPAESREQHQAFDCTEPTKSISEENAPRTSRMAHELPENMARECRTFMQSVTRSES